MIVLSFDHRVCFLRNIFGKRSDLPFSRKSDRKKEKSVVSFTHEQNSICSQKQLNDIAHEHTIVCRQLLAGHVVGVRPMKRKKHLHRMIIDIINLDSVGYHKVFHKRSSVDISPPTSWPPSLQTF